MTADETNRAWAGIAQIEQPADVVRCVLDLRRRLDTTDAAMRELAEIVRDCLDVHGDGMDRLDALLANLAPEVPHTAPVSQPDAPQTADVLGRELRVGDVVLGIVSPEHDAWKLWTNPSQVAGRTRCGWYATDATFEDSWTYRVRLPRPEPVDPTADEVARNPSPSVCGMTSVAVRGHWCAQPLGHAGEHDAEGPEPWPDDPDGGDEWRDVPAERVQISELRPGDRVYVGDAGPWEQWFILASGIGSDALRWRKRHDHPARKPTRVGAFERFSSQVGADVKFVPAADVVPPAPSQRLSSDIRGEAIRRVMEAEIPKFDPDRVEYAHVPSQAREIARAGGARITIGAVQLGIDDATRGSGTKVRAWLMDAADAINRAHAVALDAALANVRAELAESQASNILWRDEHERIVTSLQPTERDRDAAIARAEKAERERNEAQRFVGVPPGPIPWCPACGPEPRCDADGCCATCGATVGEVPDWRELKAERDEATAALKYSRDATERFRASMYACEERVIALARERDGAIARAEKAECERDDTLALLQRGVDIFSGDDAALKTAIARAERAERVVAIARRMRVDLPSMRDWTAAESELALAVDSLDATK